MKHGQNKRTQLICRHNAREKERNKQRVILLLFVQFAVHSRFAIECSESIPYHKFCLFCEMSSTFQTPRHGDRGRERERERDRDKKKASAPLGARQML